MFKIYSCVANEHDLKLVGLAAFICILASFTAFNLLSHTRRSHGRMKFMWLSVAAISTGFGIWATHFIAMLAYTAALPHNYDIAMTMVSLAAAILLTGVGLAVAIIPGWRPGPWLGGVIVGGGIATMHYLGMAALNISGIVLWDHGLVAASVVLGAAIGAIALRIGLHAPETRWKIGGAALLTLAICGLHFTGMGAISIIPVAFSDPLQHGLPQEWLARNVAFASMAIIGLALAGFGLDRRERRRAEFEVDRMRDLANASVEGLLVCDGETIVSVNTSFATLAGGSATGFIGTRLETLFPDKIARGKLMSACDELVETNLRSIKGSIVPVELILRPIAFSGRPHHVIAVRDLQARKNAEQRIHYLAHHDALTSLANRSYFNDQIDREIATLAAGERLAVLCLDLDRFKEINDLFGHAAGDAALQQVASRVTGLLSGRQMMARLGGDEFAILLPGADRAEAGRFAEVVLKNFSMIGDQPDATRISTSIGIAIHPDDANDREALLGHADTALYCAKREGRGVYRFFKTNMGIASRERRLLEHDLRLALARNEMHLLYQPQMDTQRQGIVGFEALLRWTHATRGEISPAVFIPIAEETGSILQIGDWVLKTACHEAATWNQPLSVAVNVSAVQLYNANFVRDLHQLLLETGLSPSRLEIEITETALIGDFNRALSTLRKVRALGVSIAMDDFGTGYSSLSNLRAFPFNKIKIDRSFVKSVNSNDQAAAIVRAVLGLGRGLGLPVLAEGVETDAELQFLQDESCEEVQGYLLGRPAAIDNFRHLTHAGHRTDSHETSEPSMRSAWMRSA